MQMPGKRMRPVNTRLFPYWKTGLLFLCGLLAASCGSFGQVQPYDGNASAANGERIYFTASSDRGSQITYRGGPDLGGMMMGTYLTCAACHGPGGGGGTHWMHMQVMEAPDIRLVALNDEMEEHGGEEQAEGGFDLEDFRRAVIEGLHPDGEPLSQGMPHWQMSDADLADLFAFLESLP